MAIIRWESGTAYDLFVSLYVLHKPVHFGLRPAWAAGVRSRQPAAQREFLEQAYQFLPVPLTWLHAQPGSRNAGDVLDALGRVDAAKRLAKLMLSWDNAPDEIGLLEQVAASGNWTSTDVERLRGLLARRGVQLSTAILQSICRAWSQVEEFGEKYLTALTNYYDVFFAEEEERIRPELALGLAEAQERADRLPLPRLLDELSGGVQFDALLPDEEMILVPSYWSSPLVFYNRLNAEQTLMVFGCRHESEPLVPGVALPGGLVGGLKALADPSRLRILHNLGEQPLTPSDLARRLRLRPPTVIHHLNTLRLAGLVQVILQEQGERRYALRGEALRKISKNLDEFLQSSQED